MDETCRLRRGEGYVACIDEKQDKRMASEPTLFLFTTAPQCGLYQEVAQALRLAPVWRKISAAGIKNPANADSSRDSGVPRRRLEDYEQGRKQTEFSDVTGDGGKAGALVPAGWMPEQKRVSGTCRELLRRSSGGGNKYDAPAGSSVGH